MGSYRESRFISHPKPDRVAVPMSMHENVECILDPSLCNVSLDGGYHLVPALAIGYAG